MGRYENPDYFRPLLAWAMAAGRDSAGARTELGKCPSPSQPEPREEGVQWALRAGAHHALGESEPASECLERAMELAPESELVALVQRVVSATNDRSSSGGH
jgi:hypothetical protein